MTRERLIYRDRSELRLPIESKRKGRQVRVLNHQELDPHGVLVNPSKGFHVYGVRISKNKTFRIHPGLVKKNLRFLDYKKFPLC